MEVTSIKFTGPGEAFRVETATEPIYVAEGDVLVKVSLCTLCGSDLHTFTGRRHGPCPCVLGHEIVGTIEKIGPGERTSVDGQELNVGDRIVWAVADCCGKCFFCQHDLPQKCEHLLKYGHAKSDPQRGPLGGLASHIHLFAGTGIVLVPEGIPDEVAAPSMCATATAAGALQAGGYIEGANVLIFGAGLLGLSAAAMANAAKAASVTVCDMNEDRFPLARRFGATATATPSELSSVLHSRGADVVIEMSGSAKAVEQAIASVRIGGTVVLIGSVLPTPAVPLLPEKLVRNCLKIVGVHNYTPRDLLAAMEFLGSHGSRFPFREMVERIFPLSEAEAAFRYAEAEKPIRVGVKP